MYQVKRKRYDRTSIDSRLHRQTETVGSVLGGLVQFPPNIDTKSYVCTTWATKVANYGQFLYSREELRIVANENILSSPRTPCRYRTKQPCVRSTPVKYSTNKQYVGSTPVKLGKLSVSRNTPNQSFKKTASIYLSASRYSSLFTTVIKHSKAARAALKKISVWKLERKFQSFVKQSIIQCGPPVPKTELKLFMISNGTMQ